MSTPKDVHSYLAKVPEPARSTLEKVRKAIRAAVPEAEEAISYQMPAFRYKGRFLVSYAAYKDHCSFFPMSGDVFSKHKDELKAAEAYMTGKGTLQFPLDKPLPSAIVKKIVKIRIKEMDSRY
jgi:uncharacterized protein YdhG (YjbR/CyaY superfamily)